LALVLVGFSVSLYVLASRHLHHQADERLDSTLNTLAAAAEVSRTGVEWEPQERTLSFGRRAVESGLIWRGCVDTGQRIDGSGPDFEGPLDRLNDGSASFRRPMTKSDRSGGRWRVSHRRLTASEQSEIPRTIEEPNHATAGQLSPALWLAA